MKTLLFVVVATLAVSFILADKAEWKNWKEECRSSANLSEDELKNMKHDFSDPKMRCFHTCFMEKRGFLKDGKINATMVLENFKNSKPNLEEHVENKLKECANDANKETGCEVGGSFKKCLADFFGDKGEHKHNENYNE